MIACTRDCYDTCIFDSNYRPLNIFPVNGFTCSRGIVDIKRNSINRIRSPTIDGKEVSLQTAIEYIAKVIKEVDDKSKILHIDYDGNQGLLTWYYPSRLWNVIGASTTDYSICSLEGHEAIKRVYGTSFGALPEDFLKFSSVVFWGSESAISFIHGWKILKDKFKVTIDVRLSETARRSDKYYIIKPGSDVFLAIGILKILSENLKIGNIPNLDLYDTSYISKVTGISEEGIEELARFYLEKKPLTIIGFALGRSINGGNAISTISLIPYLLGIKPGFFYANSQGWGIDFDYLRGLHLARPSKTVSMAEIGDRIDEFKVIFVWNSNPIVSLPGGNKIVEKVKEGKITLIVHDPFWSETAKIANIVIPASTFLEKEDVVYSYWHQYLVYNEPILPKKGLTEIDLVNLLSKELQIHHPLLDESPWDAVNYSIRKTGITVEQLKKEKIMKMNPKIEYNVKFTIPTPDQLIIPVGNFIVYSAHPNYTNSQFKEIYGNKTAVIYNSNFDGEGYVISNIGKLRVRFKKDDRIPLGVYFVFKSSLLTTEGLSINSVIPSNKGKYGGPLLNANIEVDFVKE
jgi:anaerobic selenocysteine-containing dehydrogenase